MSDVAGSTPEQYALKVRTHPGVLQISASNKLRSAATVQISWSGRLIELYQLKKDIKVIQNNLSNTQRFISTLPDNFDVKNKGYLWYDISADEIISFLGGIQSIENLKSYDPQNLIRFINKQLPNKELIQWRVALMSKNKATTTEFQISGESRNIGQWIRTQDRNNSDDSIYHLRKSHIISPKDEFIDLTPQEYEIAMELTRQKRQKQKKDGEPAYPNGEIVRNEIRDPKKPLLLIYLLDPIESDTGILDTSNPFVGYAISFPKSNYNVFESFAVNKELLDRFDIEDDFDDYEDYEENED